VYSLHGSVYGCAVGHATKYLLGASGRSPRATGVGPVVVAGDVAAYGLTRSGVDTVSAQMVVRRLTDGAQLASAAATARTPVEAAQSVDSLVVKSDGAVAWVGDAHSVFAPRGTDIEVHKIDRHGATLLDSGPTVSLTSLRLRGSNLSWKHGGAIRRATLD
jgi:hypothetical protein